MNVQNVQQRDQGALYGAAIGDALAMPVHWYYDRAALARDYGVVDRYLDPRNPHPDSILWRSQYQSLNKKGEILHDQATWWGQKGIHYHQFLKAGDNTLTWQLSNELMISLKACRGYRRDDYLQRYLHFLTTPGMHQDTYLEECHRGFFANYARDLPPQRCAVEEKHIGGLAGLVPIVAWYRHDRTAASAKAREHVAVTHAGKSMAEAAMLIADMLWQTLSGHSLRESILAAQGSQASRYVRHPFDKWTVCREEDIIGPKLSPACYVVDSVPAILYLALKYCDRPREGLIANTMLGGDNVHRGIVLGALLGAANGLEAWPTIWRTGLKRPPQWDVAVN